MRRTAIGLLLLALAGGPAASAQATPGFFTGVVEQPTTLARPSVQTSFADLGFGAAYVWVHWASGHPLTDEDVASVTDTIDALPPAARVVVGVGGPGRRDGVPATPLDATTRDEYCGFVRDLLEAVPTLRDVVIWNEPNKIAGWAPQYDGTASDAASLAPAAYVALLARCWDVLHAYRPDVNVIAPNTSPAGNDNPAALSNISHSPTEFIRRMGIAYRASGRTTRLFDTVAHHVYGVTPRERPWISHVGTEGRISQGDWSRLMATLSEAFSGTGQATPGQCFGGGCVWIWYTEAGFQTTVPEAKASLYSNTETEDRAVPDNVGGDPVPFVPGTPAPDQRTQIEDALRLAACQPYVQAFFNYRLVDDADLRLWQSGLLWTDDTRKGSYPYAKPAIAAAHAGTVDCDALKGGPAPTPESVPPLEPTGLKAAPGVQQVTLTWAANSDPDVLGYVIERASTPTGPWTRLTADPVSGVSFTDAVPNGETRHYAVRAVDTAANESGPSSPACGTPTALRARYAPTGLRIVSGRLRGGTALAKLAANDARRIELAAVPHAAAYRTRLEAVVRLPRCARSPDALRVELDLSALPGARVAVAVRNPRSGAWSPRGTVQAGPNDRAASFAVPLWAATRGAVAVRLTATKAAAFRSRLDLLRLAVSS
jgi:hypothetical protein